MSSVHSACYVFPLDELSPPVHHEVFNKIPTSIFYRKETSIQIINIKDLFSPYDDNSNNNSVAIAYNFSMIKSLNWMTMLLNDMTNFYRVKIGIALNHEAFYD